MKVKAAAMQAFPFIEPNAEESIKAYHPGLTLRDYFAAKAMQAMLASPELMVIVTADQMLGDNAKQRISSLRISTPTPC